MAKTAKRKFWKRGKRFTLQAKNGRSFNVYYSGGFWYNDEFFGTFRFGYMEHK